jgi:aspartate racemase
MKALPPIIGLIGGMGPEAGLRLHNFILSTTPQYKPARRDQDHLDIIHHSMGSRIVDRSAFLLKHELANPADRVFESILDLENAARTHARPVLATIVCNTFHASPIYGRLLQLMEDANIRNVRLLNLIDATVEHCVQSLPAGMIVGILSTNGAREWGIYQNALRENNIDYVDCGPALQHQIHSSIYDEKWGLKSVMGVSSHVYEVLNMAISDLHSQGATSIILGCTELSLVFNHQRWKDILIIDPLRIMGHNLIKEVVQGDYSQ